MTETHICTVDVEKSSEFTTKGITIIPTKTEFIITLKTKTSTLTTKAYSEDDMIERVRDMIKGML